MKRAAKFEPPGRLVSMDAYRGFVMLLMASEGLRIAEVAHDSFPQSPAWQFMAYQVDHVEWVGCSLWDLIQPSFTFLAGVALAFSYSSRKARGQTWGQMLRHALFRSVVLVLLGVFLRSVGRSMTYWTFEDVLSQIGLGYTFLFLLAGTRPRTQALAAALLLAGYWLAFALYPLPPPGFDYARVGVPPDWHHLNGFAAHWDKNTNLAAAFDQWFLNLFPRKHPFVFNGGGYLTLSFIPSLATMVLGLLAGELLRGGEPARKKLRILLGAGLLGILAGSVLDWLGVCPVVKRIWTPSWTLYSAGWASLLLAAFYALLDLHATRQPPKARGEDRPPALAFPLVVVGMNSIAMYCLAHLESDFIAETLNTHLGQHWAERLSPSYAPIIEQSAILFVLWLACLWLYRRKLFLRI
jgi:heparan-alpha-glucosaminide N-acetyltransferase